MTKEVLRSTYKQKRSSLTERDRSRLNDLLLIQFQRVPVPYDTGVLLNYWPLEQQSEVNTFLMADYLQFRLPGLQIAYPVINADNLTMQAMLTEDHTIFQPNRYGIAEPVNGNFIPAVSIDLIFIPLLAFDLRGYRVGYGKGFYDRFLACCRKDSIKIGFSYFEPVGAIDGIDQFDVPLTTGITPGDTYEF